MMFCEGLCGTLITVVAIVILILVLHYFYLLWNSDYWKKRGIFCPDSKALFGNLPGQVTGKRNIIYDLSDLYREYKGKYPYIGIYNFRLPRLLVFNPEIIKSILVKYFKHFQGTEFYGKIDRASDPLFGKHPFFLTGEEWKTKRAEISPAFTNTRVSLFIELFSKFKSMSLCLMRFFILSNLLRIFFPNKDQSNFSNWLRRYIKNDKLHQTGDCERRFRWT